MTESESTESKPSDGFCHSLTLPGPSTDQELNPKDYLICIALDQNHNHRPSKDGILIQGAPRYFMGQNIINEKICDISSRGPADSGEGPSLLRLEAL